ncbi:hypothetical protein [Nocardia iowensis]|uniref:Uncharacterized protein n=1 Tax=Nocardia iowensis TaxID=204891 RepID=A0ABX8RY82_NOCIO|nr:hypothetical protein [Nocardia iowensis]QXN94623.1 hypothetical protein KV110_17150 [Nocardia iowensis]
MPHNHGDVQLCSAQRCAAKWAALVVVVPGILGAVTLFPVVVGLDELTSGTKTFVQIDVAVAVAAAFVAATLAGSAIGAASSGDADGEETDWIQRRLYWSIFFGAIAVLAFGVAAISVVFVDEQQSPAKPSSVIMVVDGNAYCGMLTLASDGTVSVRGVPLSAATSIVVVDTCPTYHPQR